MRLILSKGVSSRTRHEKKETPQKVYIITRSWCSFEHQSRRKKLQINIHTRQQVFSPVMLTIS